MNDDVAKVDEFETETTSQKGSLKGWKKTWTWLVTKKPKFKPLAGKMRCHRQKKKKLTKKKTKEYKKMMHVRMQRKKS